MTFYLKYRPQTFNELDLTEVREQLSLMMVSRRMPHAFLFSGPRGLGKTSAARILAKAVNCQPPAASRQQPEKKKKKTGNWQLATGNWQLATGSSFEPCNKCEACTSITNGSALDLIEIDAASNRGIDDIRALREKIKSSPLAFAKKVYVIDEVHMLTKEAFNALLKTLEEPPEHALFVLATTEPQKLPETIISRCTHIKFRKATTDELVRSLKRIVRGERLKIEKNVLKEMAKKVDGSFRDAAKILEQLSFSGKKITKKDVENLRIGKSKDEFLKALKEKNHIKALSWVDEAGKGGVDWKDFLVEFLEDLRGALLAHFNILKSEIEGFSLEELKSLIRIFNQAAVELKNALIVELPIELAVIEYCSAEQNQEQRTKNREPRTENQEQKGKQKTKKKTPSSKLQVLSSTNDSNQTSDLAVDLLEVEKKWSEILQTVKPQNHSIEALLRSCRPKDVKGRSVIVEVFYEFHKGRLEIEKHRAIVESSLQKALNNKDLKISYVLGNKKPPATSHQQPAVIDKVNKENGELVKNVEEIFGNES